MIFRLFLIASVAATLSACSIQDDRRAPSYSEAALFEPHVGPIDYTKYGVQRLKVGEIQIVQTFKPMYHAPNVEHRMFLPPYIALRDWAKERFDAVGSTAVAFGAGFGGRDEASRRLS